MRFMHVIALGFLLPVAAYGQKLSPEEAVAVLRADHSLLDRTNAVRGDGPTVVIIRSSPTSGPFGEFRPFAATAPLSNGPYFYRTGAQVRIFPHVGAGNELLPRFPTLTPFAAFDTRTVPNDSVSHQRKAGAGNQRARHHR